MIFDTNILVYVSQNILKIENLIGPEIIPAISTISYIEALGFKFITQADQSYMLEICSSCKLININYSIIHATIDLRKNHRIKLPDAIIYATALTEGLPLITNNIADFKNLGNKVELVNPFTL